MAELVFAVFVPSVTSVAVTVVEPPVRAFTLNVCAPATRAAFGGSTAAGSDEVMATTSVEETWAAAEYAPAAAAYIAAIDVVKNPAGIKTAASIQPVSAVSFSWPTRSAITSLAPGR